MTLFPGDQGVLELEERRALVQLLAGPFVDGRRNPKLWPVVVRSEDLLRSRLADLFLDLVIDPDQQVAFTRALDTAELDTPVLLRRVQLTFLDSVLLVYLRLRLTQAEVQGLRAVVSTAEMEEQLRLYERSGSTDRAGYGKRMRASLEKFKKHNLLQKLRGTEDRFEVSPTLKLLFPPEEIRQLTERYEAREAALEEPEEGDDD